MTESYVQIAPDGAGKQIDAFTVGGGTLYRQAVVVADPTTQGNVATVTAAGALQVSDVVIGGAVSGTGGGTTTLSTTDPNVALAGSNDAPIFTAITGDPSGDFAGINLFEAAMDSGGSLGFNVRVQNQPLQDQNGALIISDAPNVQQLSGPAGASFVVWMGGYKSLAVAVPAGITVTYFGSVDGVNYSTLTGILAGGVGGWTSGIAGTSNFIIPANMPWIKLTINAAGTINICRRNVDIPALMGVVNSGSASAFVPAVGGNVASGIAPTANPVLTAGWDGTLTRTLRTDTIGRVYVVGSDLPGVVATNNAPLTVAGVDTANIVRRFGVLPNQIGNINSAQVQDITATEGQTQIEILLQILTELKILNYYAQNLGSSQTDDPTVLRADPSFITQ